MDFKLFLESTQDDVAFIRGFFEDDMDKDTFLVWADHEEERGNNTKANFLRKLADVSGKRVSTALTWADFFNMFDLPKSDWEAETDFHGRIWTYRPPDPRYPDSPRYWLNYYRNEWFASGDSWAGALNVKEIPDEALCAAFVAYITTLKQLPKGKHW